MILEYLGPYAKNGSLKTATRIRCNCFYCKREFVGLVGAVAHPYGDSSETICRICASHGKPRTPELVLAEHSQIKRVRIVGNNRNHVSGAARIWVDCRDCGLEYETKFDAVLRLGNNIRCKSCTCRVGHKMPMVFPDQMKDELVSWRPETLGNIGQFVEHTRISYKCYNCGDVYETRYGNYRKGLRRCSKCALSKNNLDVFPETVNCLLRWNTETLGKRGQLVSSSTVTITCNKCRAEMTTRWYYVRENTRHGNELLCFDCGSRVGATEDGRKIATEKIKIKWANPELKEKYLAKRRMGDYSKTLSGLHQKVKNLLCENGYTQFKSEQWVGRGVRVDEVDYSTKTVIEVYGDYFHANPIRYKADDKLKFPGRTAVVASDVWRNDEDRIAKLQSWGYRVVIIWESDFKHDKNKLLDILRTVM